MPLVPATLQAQLASTFANPPETAQQCAQAWANAMQAYAAAIVPPSTTVAAATSALSTALAVAFTQRPSGAAAMENAFAAFAVSLGGGMAGYVAVPPVAPIGFASLFATHPATHAEAAQRLTSAIDSWMRTGTATLIAPPGTVVPWS